MSPLSGEEKAALLLKNLPPEMAASLLERLGPERAARVRAQLERLDQQKEPSPALEQVLDEFHGLLDHSADTVEISGHAPGVKAYQETRHVEPPGVGPMPAEGPTPATDTLAALGQMNPDLLARALEGELPRTVALILNGLETQRAGEILKRLSPNLRRQVSLQLDQPMVGGMELLQRIAQAIVQKSTAVGQAPVVETGDAKFKKMADMLRLLDKPERLELLTTIEQNNAETATRLKQFLYQFEDLLLIEDRSMQKLLAEIDMKTLATALKGATDEIKQRVTNNLSQRARTALEEELSFLGTVPANQMQQAQKAVVDVIQRLDQAGELVMNQ
jgi:flagellar motor switch protein FliG